MPLATLDNNAYSGAHHVFSLMAKARGLAKADDNTATSRILNILQVKDIGHAVEAMWSLVYPSLFTDVYGPPPAGAGAPVVGGKDEDDDDTEKSGLSTGAIIAIVSRTGMCTPWLRYLYRERQLCARYRALEEARQRVWLAREEVALMQEQYEVSRERALGDLRALQETERSLYEIERAFDDEHRYARWSDDMHELSSDLQNLVLHMLPAQGL